MVQDIRNFLLGLSKAPESNLQIRSKIKERMTVEGNKKLYYELKSVDPVYAKRIHINDEYRILYLGDIRENTFDRLCEIADKERASTTNRIYINYGVLDGLKYDLQGTGLYIIE